MMADVGGPTATGDGPSRYVEAINASKPGPLGAREARITDAKLALLFFGVLQTELSTLSSSCTAVCPPLTRCLQVGVAFLETASPAREPSADQEERDTACRIRSRPEHRGRRSVLARRHTEVRLTVRRPVSRCQPLAPLLMPLQKPEPVIIPSHYAALCPPECHSQVTPERRLSSPVPNVGQ